ncbi:hypothetical protein R8Z50_10750 [Longispora sp. K20-0274]|uniref:hypothetical protein n=1 Tax=Longispora sp. K20-0274 TaxID=3088255 RepID=UPI003999F90D
MSTRPLFVLDTGALIGYVHGTEAVGQILVDAADAAQTVAVPVVCLLEAYGRLDNDEHELLRMLRRNPSVITVVPAIDLDTGDDCPAIGAMTRLTGRLGAAHAAYLGLVYAAAVVTSHAHEIHAALPKWKVIEV